MSATHLHDTPKFEPGRHPALPPPVATTGAVAWLRTNLFSSPSNIIVSLIAIYILWSIIPPLLDWLVFDAVVDAGSRNECREIASGACWAVVKIRLAQFTYGFYPEALRWRVDIAFLLLIIGIAVVAMESQRTRVIFGYVFLVLFLIHWLSHYRAPWQLGVGVMLVLVLRDLVVSWKDEWRKVIGLGMLVVYPVIAYFLLWGGLGLEPVGSDQFGGFMLTILIGVTGIVVSLPMGILLALGRQSNLFLIRIICVTFIEVMRGVPLITLLFVASTLLNYFLPPGTSFDLLLRVLIMVTLFAAAYIAEVVRGGLQAIPTGQFEAGDALGLTYWKTMGLIILPQAMKISIPGIVNTFIGLYKDTTLVVIIGLLDPLGLSQSVLADSKWQGLSTEIYVFIALFFFISCFSMSRYSMHLESKLQTGYKR